LASVAGGGNSGGAVDVHADVPLVLWSAVPVWMPMRTRIGLPASSCMPSVAASSAPRAVGKATKNASPACRPPPRRAAGTPAGGCGDAG
jgi:hypothetical protein